MTTLSSRNDRPQATTWDARDKILGLFAIGILAMIPVDKYWPIHLFLCLLLFFAFLQSGVSLKSFSLRLAGFLVFLTPLVIAIPLSRGWDEGFDVMTNVIVQSVLSFSAALLLLMTTKEPDLIAGLRRLWVPSVLVDVIAFMLRYRVLFATCRDQYLTAVQARSYGPKRRWHWLTNARIVGMLLIRALERARRVQWAILSRGGDQPVALKKAE